LGYKEVKKERKTWDERALTIEDEAKVRGCKDIYFLKKNIVKVHKFLDKRAIKGLMLDVGCGNAQFTVNMADLFNFVVGIDISKEMIKRQKLKLSNVSFVLGSATDLPFKNMVFDSIISFSTLQFIRPITNLKKTLLEISRCSRRRSFIFLNYPSNSLTSVIKQILSVEGYKLRQSLISRLRLKRFIKIWGIRNFSYGHELFDEICELIDSIQYTFTVL